MLEERRKDKGATARLAAHLEGSLFLLDRKVEIQKSSKTVAFTSSFAPRESVHSLGKEVDPESHMLLLLKERIEPPQSAACVE